MTPWLGPLAFIATVFFAAFGLFGWMLWYAHRVDAKLGKTGTVRVTHCENGWYVEILQLHPGSGGLRRWAYWTMVPTRQDVERLVAGMKGKPRIRIRAGVGSGA